MTQPPAPSFTCPACGMTSHNPDDVREGYCGVCHDWTGQRRPGYARHVLNGYMRRLNLDTSRDAAAHLSVTMLLDMVERLEAIMADERIDRQVADRILRTLIYGSLPHKADMELREEMLAAHTALASVTAVGVGFHPRS